MYTYIYIIYIYIITYRVVLFSIHRYSRGRAGHARPDRRKAYWDSLLYNIIYIYIERER